MKKRTICIVTTSRADYGILSGLIHEVANDPALRLQLVVSGAHVSRGPNATIAEIRSEAVSIHARIPMPMSGRSALSGARGVSQALPAFARTFSKSRPDIVVLLGDRFELFAPAISALMLRVPIAHIHGGEITEGAIDDSVRHAITKMASVHFTATEQYRARVVQMGEDPKTVYNFGSPGLDLLHQSRLLPMAQLEDELQFDLRAPVALVTYHAVTRESQPISDQLDALEHAILQSKLRAIVTMANLDEGGSIINRRLKAMCRAHPEVFRWIPSLGHLRYLSALQYVSVLVGNSSSGLIEAPAFRLPVVNIGPRQRGRVRAANVIDVRCDERAISRGIRRAMSPQFRSSLKEMKNPYDQLADGRTSRRIKNVLRDLDLSERLIRKTFHNLTL